MNERYTPEDFETLRKAQFIYDEQMKYLAEERARLYTTDSAQKRLDEIEQEAIETRKAVFVALGLESDDEILY